MLSKIHLDNKNGHTSYIYCTSYKILKYREKIKIKRTKSKKDVHDINNIKEKRIFNNINEMYLYI